MLKLTYEFKKYVKVCITLFYVLHFKNTLKTGQESLYMLLSYLKSYVYTIRNPHIHIFWGNRKENNIFNLQKRASL